MRKPYANTDENFSCIHVVYLGAIAKFRKPTVSFVISVRLYVHPSVRMEWLDSHWTDFHYIWYSGIFRKSVEKIRILLKSDKNNRYLTRRPMCIYGSISLSSS
jgi:hypothetical protein